VRKAWFGVEMKWADVGEGEVWFDIEVRTWFGVVKKAWFGVGMG